jgi:hypothetical protein
MTTSPLIPFSIPTAAPVKRNRVLLVDASPPKRELRAEAMRKLGLEVDCACDISEARSWWRAGFYTLVLINLENDLGRDKFCDDVRAATPSQKLAFLVGKPAYLAQSPTVPDPLQSSPDANTELRGDTSPLNIGLRSALPWGILEASRRISAARSAYAARSEAVRNRPTPPRDPEVRAFNRHADVLSQLASELRKEKLL